MFAMLMPPAAHKTRGQSRGSEADVYSSATPACHEGRTSHTHRPGGFLHLKVGAQKWMVLGPAG